MDNKLTEEDILRIRTAIRDNNFKPPMWLREESLKALTYARITDNAGVVFETITGKTWLARKVNSTVQYARLSDMTELWHDVT